jgi:hypothetical protein
MLDWGMLELDFEGRKVVIDNEMLFGALQTHDVKHSFTRDEMRIRELFDDYFDGLTEFLILSECGLVNRNDMRKFLNYWIQILNGERSGKPEKLKSQMDSYMLFYGFDKLHRFIQRKHFSF